MLEPVASCSHTHSIHIRDYQGLVSIKQTQSENETVRGERPKAVSKITSLGTSIEKELIPKTAQRDVWGQSCTFLIPLDTLPS